MGAIVKENDKYIAKDIVLKHEDNINYIYIVSLNRAIEHLKQDPLDKSSYFDSFCIIVSEAEYESVKKTLEESKNKIAGIIQSSKNIKKEKICFLNMNLFYASN